MSEIVGINSAREGKSPVLAREVRVLRYEKGAFVEQKISGDANATTLGPNNPA